MYVHTTKHMWVCRTTFRSQFFPSTVYSWVQAVMRVGNKCLYLMSHLTNLRVSILKNTLEHRHFTPRVSFFASYRLWRWFMSMYTCHFLYTNTPSHSTSQTLFKHQVTEHKKRKLESNSTPRYPCAVGFLSKPTQTLEKPFLKKVP